MVFLHYNQYHSFKEIRGTQLDSYTIYLNFERLTLILKQTSIIILPFILLPLIKLLLLPELRLIFTRSLR